MLQGWIRQNSFLQGDYSLEIAILKFQVSHRLHKATCLFFCGHNNPQVTFNQTTFLSLFQTFFCPSHRAKFWSLMKGLELALEKRSSSILRKMQAPSAAALFHALREILTCPSVKANLQILLAIFHSIVAAWLFLELRSTPPNSHENQYSICVLGKVFMW